MSSPDVVDSRFPEQVDTLLEAFTPLLKVLHHKKRLCGDGLVR